MSAPPPPQTQPLPSSGEGSFQIELVDGRGHAILQRPIDVHELLRQYQYTLPIADGVSVRLEEYHHNHDDDEYDESDAHTAAARDGDNDDEDDSDNSSENDDNGSYDDDDEEGSGAAGAPARHGPPPGTRQATGWYDVLDELRREDAGRSAEERRLKGYSAPGGAVRPGARRPPSAVGRPVATPMKLFPTARPTSAARSRSLGDHPASGKDVSAAGGGAGQQSRRDVWASYAPPADPETNYKRIDYVSVMDGVSGVTSMPGRHFRPSALSFHAMASYLSAKDNGQRVLVYGGVSSAAMAIQKELYEFSLLTGNWRRLEGRQFVPEGHMGHAMAVVEAVDRLIVVGGVGPCGAGAANELRPSAFADDEVRALRARLFFPKELLSGKTRGAAVAAVARAVSPVGSAVVTPAAPAPAVGFVPLLFDMSLSDQRWRAIQTAQPFPLAFHTAIAFGSELYVFGGLTEELVVSGQLIAIDTATYALRLVQTVNARGSNGDGGDGDGDGNESAAAADAHHGPGPHFLHTAVRYGNYMIVHGGFNAHNEPQSDTWAFDLVNERWERLRCHAGEGRARAGHTASLIGCRMLVVGGFACSLDEAANSGEGEEAGGPATEHVVMELNLVPNIRGEYIWRDDVKMRPPLPPLVYSASAPCGDDCSLVVFGGLTKRPKFKRAVSGPKSAQPRRAHSSSTGRPPRPAPTHDSDESAATPFLKQLITLDDAVIMTFPRKQHRRHGHDGDDDDEPHVNALGVEVDPDEMPESFKTFVRRQDDFLKKKEAAAAETQRKITLEEKEAMAPTIYFTGDEIERMIEKSEELCACFTEYKMDTLPGNVPDRERRIKLTENCVSLSRQVRDVVRSMKGSQNAVTAVKSTSHRRRAGQKFEDFSAAKPFRRVVVDSLINEINEELAIMHRLNKALRTVDWDEKEGFQETCQDMQATVHGFTAAGNAIMGKYVNNRVEKLMKGVDKHREVMRLLTEVVTRNREDKLWARDEARDQLRGKSNARRDKEAVALDGAKPAKRLRSRSTAATTAAQPRRSSTGVGYHADESTASVQIIDREWEAMVDRASKLETRAESLADWCREGMKSTVLDEVGSAAPLTVAAPAAVVLAVAVAVAPLPAAPAVPVAIPPPLAALPARNHDSASDSDSDTDTPVRAPIVASIPPPLPVPAGAVVPPVERQPGWSTAPATAPETTSGAASPKEILIRRSNANREAVMDVARRVAEAARQFRAALETGPEAAPVAAATTPPTPVAPAVIALPPPPPPPPTQLQQRIPVSCSSSSSASSSSISGPASAAVPAPQPIAIPAPAAVVTFPELVPDAVSTPPPQATAAALPATLPATAPVTAPLGYHTFFLSALRPLLEVKELLDRIGPKVPLIHCNEWDGNDLAGAPPDTKAEAAYKRVSATLGTLAQGITASFLAAAGAKKPRQHSAVSVKPPPPAKRSASRKAKPTAVTPAAPVTAPYQRTVRQLSRGDRRSRSAGTGAGGENAAAAVSIAEHPAPRQQQQRPPTLRLSKMALSPRSRFSDMPGPAAAQSPVPPQQPPSAPLVSFESFLRASEVPPTQSGTAFAPPSPVSNQRMVVEVAPIAPNQRVVRRPVVAGASGGDAGPSSSSIGVFAPPVIAVAAGPKFVMPPPPAPATGSAIEDLAALISADGAGGAFPSAAAQPATSIAPGPFVVNPKYFYNTYAPPQQQQQRPERSATRTTWADAEEDYFYFGRQMAEPRSVPLQQSTPGIEMVSPAFYTATAPAAHSVNVTVSPPVGTALGSQRVNAAIVDETARRRLRHPSATARAPATTGRVFGDATNTYQRPSTAAAAAGGGGSREAPRKRLTPGELQILQGRERLRRH